MIIIIIIIIIIVIIMIIIISSNDDLKNLYTEEQFLMQKFLAKDGVD